MLMVQKRCGLAQRNFHCYIHIFQAIDQYKLKYRGGPYNVWCCAKQDTFMSALISGTMNHTRNGMFQLTVL